MEFKLFAKCAGCKKKRLYIAKRTVRLPIGMEATSQEMYCNPCFRPLQEKIIRQHDEHAQE